MRVISGIEFKTNSSMATPQLENQLIQTEKLTLSGMHCAACVQLIEFREGGKREVLGEDESGSLDGNRAEGGMRCDVSE